MMIVQLTLCVCAGVAESVTWIVNENVPAVVGVPVIAPVVVFRVSPGGSEPEVTEKVYGVTPPAGFTDPVYPTATCPVPVGQFRVSGATPTKPKSFVSSTYGLRFAGIVTASGFGLLSVVLLAPPSTRVFVGTTFARAVWLRLNSTW